MEAGYVLDFSDRIFRDFFKESIDINIDDQKYCIDGPSKAKRLRFFLRLESDLLVVILLKILREHYSLKDSRLDQIIDRLSKNQEINLDYILLNDFKNGNTAECAESIVRILRAGKPNEALDRLHTLSFGVLNFLRQDHDREKPLDSVYGQYIKTLEIEEETFKILRSQISVFKELNDIRNNKSLAHPNPLLKDNDLAIYIIKSVSIILEFLIKKNKNL